ncbi:MAG: hypothetical protein GF331_05845, partial [Chitinivibrionales bacterium]|nr:hypothetical protein [Chitinivibrionales bacterium]
TEEHLRESMYPRYEGAAIMLMLEYRLTGDRGHFDAYWPRVRDGLFDQLSHDKNGDGLPDGLLTGLTYDHWFVPATNCYRCSMWLAALRAGEYLATLAGESEAAKRLHDTCAQGAESFEKLLWNGAYYDFTNDEHRGLRDSGCLADQVSGHLYLHLCGREKVHPRKHVLSALRAVYAHNRRPECGLLNGADPRGRTDWTYFARYSQRGDDERLGGQWVSPWSGTEYYVAALMIAEGLVDEGLQVVKDVVERYVDFGIPYNHIECGEHYFRANAIWAVLYAAQGVVCDVAAKSLAVAPRVQVDDHQSLLMLPGGWGHIEQRRSGAGQTTSVSMVRGSLALRRVSVGLPPGGPSVRSVEVRVAGTAVDISYATDGCMLAVELGQDVRLEQGALSVIVTWSGRP